MGGVFQGKKSPDLTSPEVGLFDTCGWPASFLRCSSESVCGSFN